jgi:uncharacterized protein
MPEAIKNGSKLCVPCGLCCDGSLFERARLQPGEEAFAASLGLTVLDAESERPAFRLGCHLFQGSCSIYDQPRPHICGGFKCSLLIKYEGGQVGLTEGLEKVSRARAMQSELGPLLPNPIQGVPSLAEIKRQMQALTDASQRRAHLNFLILAAQYEMFLRTHFLHRLAKNLPADKLPGMGEAEVGMKNAE